MHLFKITFISIFIFSVFISFFNKSALSQGQGNINIGPLNANILFGERVELDDNVFQVAGKTNSDGIHEDKESDVINIYSPGLKLNLPFKGGEYIPGKEHMLFLDYHSDFKNYRDNAKQNQQNHYFFLSGNFVFPGGFEISMEDDYNDVFYTAGSETDKLDPNITNTGSMTVNLPDIFKKLDAEVSYTHYDQEYDEYALRRANRFEQEFTIRIPYQILPKVKIFPEYSYGFIEYDSRGVADAQSDSHYNKVYAGVEWDITGKTTGIAKFGFMHQDYDQSETGDTSDLITEIGARVELTKRTQLDIMAGRGPSQSEFTLGSNAYVNSYVDLDISRQVWKDLLVSVNASFDRRLFHGSKRKDHVFAFGVKAKKQINKWLFADFRYSHFDRHSNFELQSDRINRISLGINIDY